MDQSIKERLALLQKGDVPQGYRKAKAGIMPIDWDDTIRAKDVFKNYTDKKHNGELEILASTQENGIVPRSQIGIDIQCSDEGVAGYKKVSQGDFVISLRSFQGGIEYSRYEGIVSPAYTVLKPIKSISDVYYQHYFKTSRFIQRLNSAVYGIRDGKQIGYQDFGDLYIHYPPIDEQKKIAEILMQCDKLIELKRQRIEEEKNKKKWILEETMKPPKGILDLSNKYTGTLEDLVSKIETGTSVNSTDDVNSGIDSNHKFVLKTSAICDGVFIETECKKVVPEDYHRTSCAVEGGTLLVSRMNTPKLVGACAVCYKSLPNVYLPDRLWKVSVKATVDPRWLNYILNSAQYKNLIQERAGGTSNSMKNISQKDFLGLPISPPLYEKQVIIGDTLSSIDNLIQKLEEEVDAWMQKKKLMMRLLLTGIVRVKL